MFCCHLEVVNPEQPSALPEPDPVTSQELDRGARNAERTIERIRSQRLSHTNQVKTVPEQDEAQSRESPTKTEAPEAPKALEASGASEEPPMVTAPPEESEVPSNAPPQPSAVISRQAGVSRSSRRRRRG